MRPQKEIEELCKKLKPIIGKQAETLWHLYLAEDDMDRKNTAHDIEILAEKYLKQEPLEDKQILLGPPLAEDSKGTYLIGDIIYNRKKLHKLYLNPEDFRKQVGIFAITGEGKTNLANLLALQLLQSKTPFMVIDWKRSWRNLLSLKDQYPELKNVQVFTIGRNILPFLWNAFRPPPGADKEQWISTISEALEKSHLSGPGVAYFFNKIYSKLVKNLQDNHFYPNFYDGLRELKNAKVFARELNWKQTALRIFQSFTMGHASKVFNARNPIKLEELLNKPVILELDLELPKPLRVFFSEMILRWIHLYRLGQGETEKLQHVLFLEEAHHLFSDPYRYKETNSLENIYREIRAFGQGIVSITQHPSMLPVYLLGNCHTQIYLGLQHADDIQTARKSLFLNYDEEFYLSLLNIGECIVKIKNRIEPCLVKTPLVPVQKELVSDDWLKSHNLGAMMWDLSWKGDQGKTKYVSLKNCFRDILSGKKTIAPVLDKKNTPGYSLNQFKRNTPVSRLDSTNQIPNAGLLSPVNIKDKNRKSTCKIAPYHRLLIDILEYPFSTVTQRYKRLNLYLNAGNRYRKKLIADKCIQPRKIITSQGWITLCEITQKGKAVLQDIGYEFKNESEGIVHKFWKHKISEYYQNMGLDVRIEEYYINGRPDIIVNKNDKKVAIEIETGKSDFVKNVKQALEAGFDEIVVVGVNRFIERKIRGELGKKGVVDGRIRIVNTQEYIV